MLPAPINTCLRSSEPLYIRRAAITRDLVSSTATTFHNLLKSLLLCDLRLYRERERTMLSIMRISTLDLRLLRYQLIGACGIIVALTLLTSCTIVSGINGPSLVQSGQANNSGYVYPSFSECETELFCGFANYDEFLMASGVKWQEWQYPNEPPYYLLVQDGWWGIMPGARQDGPD